MRKLATIATAALLLALALPAPAATTWTSPTLAQYPSTRVSKAECTTGTEAAPTLVTQGLYLAGLESVTVHAEAGSPMTAGAQLLAYEWNPVSLQWNRVADTSLDLPVSAIAGQAWPYVAVSGIDRIAWVPSGVGVAVTITAIGVKRR